MLLQQAFHNYKHIIQHIFALLIVDNVYVKLLFIDFLLRCKYMTVFFINPNLFL